VYNPGGTDYSGLSAGTGDIQQDPLFVDRPADDYHLQYTSPCANTGNNSYVQSGWVDMDGEDRIQNGIVDIGADELVVTRIPGDANDDKKVNLQDLSILATYYGQSNLPGDTWLLGDFNGDKAVGLQDLSILAANYGYGM